MKNFLICGAFIAASLIAFSASAEEPTNLLDLFKQKFSAQPQEPDQNGQDSFHPVQDGIFHGAFDRFASSDDEGDSNGGGSVGHGSASDAMGNALGGLFN